jgi:hypothetical protein
MTKRKKLQTIEYASRFVKDANAEPARMVEMIRVNLGELMKMVTLTRAGREVQVDGFRLCDTPGVTYDLSQPVSQKMDGANES